MTGEDLLKMSDDLEAYLAGYDELLGRVENREHLRRFARGQLGPIERKSLEPIADAVGYETGGKDGGASDMKEDGDKTGAASDDGKADKDAKPEKGKAALAEAADAEATSDDEGASQGHGHAPAPEQVHVEYGFYPHHWARHSKTVGEGEDAVTTKFLYDGDNVVAEYGEYEVADVTYVTPFLDQNLAMTIPEGLPSAGTYYYMQDGLGSVRNIADSAGVTKNTYDYESFGQPFAPGTSTTVPNPFTYTARRADAESGGMYYRFRQYDARVGRFGGRDPIGHSGVEGLYAYVSNSPIPKTDPMGLWAPDDHAKLTRDACADLGVCEDSCCNRIVGQNIAMDWGNWIARLPVGYAGMRKLHYATRGSSPSWDDLTKAKRESDNFVKGRLKAACDAAKRGWCKDAVYAFAEALHTIQDRWCHGRYVENPETREDKLMPWGGRRNDYDNWRSTEDAEKHNEGQLRYRMAELDTIIEMGTFMIDCAGCCCDFPCTPGQKPGTRSLCRK